jgi:thiol-disulfide isomerase/thioredoxin
MGSSNWKDEISYLKITKVIYISDINFYMNCPYCQRLAPDFAKVADDLNNTANLKFGEINYPAYGDVCDKRCTNNKTFL